MKIYNSVIDLIGNTPLVKLNSIGKNLKSTIVVKLESSNPLSSVKDRLALALIEDGEKSGKLKPGATLIEATSGNTGIGLAYLGAIKGYKVTIVMPDGLSKERQNIIKAFGAEVVLTDVSEGYFGSIAKAKELSETIEDGYLTSQFSSPANVEEHRLVTGEEIWNDTDGKVDIVVAGVGTGGTISGIGRCLKAKDKEVEIYAVEPAGSAVLSTGEKGKHAIEGIGVGFIPDVFDFDVVDRVWQVEDEAAKKMARRLAREEGLFCGISSGAALAAGLEIAAKHCNEGKFIVVILPDSGERYLASGLFDV